MNLKTWLPLCLAIVLGLVAAKFARDTMSKNKGNGQTSGVLAQVVVASRQIGAGESLTAENCQMGNVGADTIPEGSFRSIGELKDRVAQVQLGKGLPITGMLLAPNGTGTGLQVIIPEGMRAISIEVNEFSGVGGMLVPGCHVDVLATLPAEQGGEMIARTVVQNVEIAAVGQRMVSQPEKKGDEPTVFRSVTILATPAETEAIELAANNGRPRLSLRGGNDKELTMTNGITSSNLRGHVAPKTDPRYFSVRIIRGTVESEFRMDNSVMVRPTSADAKTDTKALSGAETAPAGGESH